ncbi:MAG: DHA2 family efflux MFS transporter permease subunit [Burkholderiales bacterium]
MTSETATTPVEFSRVRRYLILVTVAMCTMLYAMTVTIVNVALPQLQGALSATPDQIAWVVSLNVVATAVVTPMTGWLVARLGQRTVLISCIVGFAITSLLCATAASLGSLLAYRVGQGIFGAPIVPLSQAILLITFTGRDRAMAQGFFGMSVVVGPAVGPALGGYLAETYNWRWIFFLIVPLCIAAFIMVVSFIRQSSKDKELKLDWTGFLSLALAIVCVQLMVDRGERFDWFASGEIILYACGAVLSFYVLVVHTMTSERPFLNPELFTDRNFAIGMVLVFVYGMLNFTPITLLPPMLQNLKGYPDSLIGLLLAMRGVSMVIGFFIAGRMGRFDPRVGLTSGMLLVGVSGAVMATFDFNVSPETVAWAGIVQGIGTGVMWVPLTIVAFASLPERLMPDASALFHLLRNFGTSLFIAVSFMVVLRTAQISHFELVQNVSPYNEALRFPSVVGHWDIGSLHGLAKLGSEVDRQAQMIGYENAFIMYAAVCFATIPVLLFVRIRHR